MFNKTNYPLKGKFKPSIFETNPFLLKNTFTAIEYAAFFGSLQIFKYLELNECKFQPSIWLFAVHSDYPEIIHLIEESVRISNDTEVYIESIKYNHNSIANYIEGKYQVTFMDEESKEPIFESFNFSFIKSFQN